ncbi:GIY-YIG nuclease family protein [Bdellovibrio sp. HCB337]|uniref:GIY-YIG nuclease family protein n=1 Tax=Bdellovibrio sp. HCB337 TaxID=3394358 RepID=UPI0039A5BEAF
MKLLDLSVFFLDLQTTGAKPDNSNILEAAWGDIQKIESALVAQPEGASVPYRIQAITGISNEDMSSALPLAEVLQKLRDFIQPLGTGSQKPLAVIHYAQFEKPFLMHAFHEDLPFEILCTHEIAKRLMPNLPSRGVKGLAGYFGYNAGELKRASSHLEATRVIWQGLLSALEKEQNITTLEELRNWLEATPKKSRTKYEYPLPKEKRLSLPDQPGIYRMISRWGEVLYVGKATSLHSRVNSYFRGQKNRDPRKLEMLTQTWDLLVTPCGSPLEAALLETDEIKKLNPRYNISLKTGNRSMVFYNHDFTSESSQQDEEHNVGPFPNTMTLDSMLKLTDSLQAGEFNPLMFYEEIDPELLKSGFQIFCERHGFDTYDFTSMRSILAVGLWWHRHEEEDEALEDDVAEEEIEQEIEDEEVELTPEDIADKFERHFLRAGRAYARVRLLTRLLNSDIEFQLVASPSPRHMILRQGKIQSEIPENPTMDALPWKGLSIDTYDRMSILQSELQKIKSQHGKVIVHKLHS